jgi:hypothetical protein
LELFLIEARHPFVVALSCTAKMLRSLLYLQGGVLHNVVVSLLSTLSFTTSLKYELDSQESGRALWSESLHAES